MLSSLPILLVFLGQLPPINGDAEITGPTESGPIVIRTSTRFAGAIYSLIWDHMEFIDTVDHGRELQSASNLDLGTPITGETFNPTEAGSRDDSDKFTTSSVLESLSAKRNHLETSSLMAFWLAPGELSGGNPAKNQTVLSRHRLLKSVTVGLPGHPHIIPYAVTFQLPTGEHHNQAVFEALTGYMPESFSRFWHFEPISQTLEPLTDGPGEQGDPVVLATEDGKHAMGIYSGERQSKGYGRFRFGPEHVVKWNCVFRVTNPTPGGRYSYAMDVVVGTVEQVRADLAFLSSQRK